MITKSEHVSAVRKTMAFFERAGIVVTDEEKSRIEIADFGLGILNDVGLEILTYINTERVCAKEMVLFPFQACPQHKHVEGNGRMGKEETFRVRKGAVYLFVEGDGKPENIKVKMPATVVNVFHEIKLTEGMQYTIYPNTWHWFCAGSLGAVISEFSTTSTDETDIFLDEKISRMSKTAE